MHSPYEHSGFPPKDSQSLSTSAFSDNDTMSDSDMDIEMEHLKQSKSCDNTCCDHSYGCKCDECFCQVRNHLQINESQTTYGGQGGSSGDIAGERRTCTTGHDPVNALATELASLRTHTSGSVPIEIARHGLRPDSLIAPPSFDSLRQRDAHQSYEERMRINVQRLNLNVDIPTRTDFDNSPLVQRFPQPNSDCDPIFDFEFESHDLSRYYSNDLPPDTLSLHGGRSHSHNDNITLQGAGDLFADVVGMGSQYRQDMPLCFDPLQVVPECRHGRAADCA